MEESASHHVMQCFLLRLRRRKYNFKAPGPSPVDLFGFPDMLQKTEISNIFGRRFEMCSEDSEKEIWNQRQIQRVQSKRQVTLIGDLIFRMF